jgi:Ni/Co efflux regulator RcnB
MKKIVLGLVAVVLVSAGLLSAADPAGAADGSAQSAKTKKHRVKVAKLKADDDRFLHGSKETQTMRDSRLTRECRGAVNGGACSGYTR